MACPSSFEQKVKKVLLCLRVGTLTQILADQLKFNVQKGMLSKNVSEWYLNESIFFVNKHKLVDTILMFLKNENVKNIIPMEQYSKFVTEKKMKQSKIRLQDSENENKNNNFQESYNSSVNDDIKHDTFMCRCNYCGKSKEKHKFSKNQWKKRSNDRTCNDCVPRKIRDKENQDAIGRRYVHVLLFFLFVFLLYFSFSQ